LTVGQNGILIKSMLTRKTDRLAISSKQNVHGRFKAKPRALGFLALLCVSLWLASHAAFGAGLPQPRPPTKIIFDTDIGNDVDDVLALSVLHALETRHQCRLLAVTITKPDELAGPFVDAMNTFYGRPQIPIGFTHSHLPNTPSKFLFLANVRDHGILRFPHDLQRSSDAPEAVHLLRKILAAQPDKSVVIVQVGYFSNLAALLSSAGDEFSPLTGPELAARKVKLLSVMAGAFRMPGHFLEFNVMQDLPASKKVARKWPTPIVWSGYEIGDAVRFPAMSIERDFSYVPHHPAAEAYCLYNPPPHERPCWDLTSTLYAVCPDRGYFGLSAPGRVTIERDGLTRFTPKPGGRDRCLILSKAQIPRVKEALVQLASQPPCRPEPATAMRSPTSQTR
jgi:Inosine-uridine preferring nucleoside hydrolase